MALLLPRTSTKLVMTTLRLGETHHWTIQLTLIAHGIHTIICNKSATGTAPLQAQRIHPSHFIVSPPIDVLYDLATANSSTQMTPLIPLASTWIIIAPTRPTPREAPPSPIWMTMVTETRSRYVHIFSHIWSFNTEHAQAQPPPHENATANADSDGAVDYV